MSKIRECIDIVGDFDCMECGEVQMTSGCQEDKAPCKWNVLSDAALLELEAYEKVVGVARSLVALPPLNSGTQTRIVDEFAIKSLNMALADLDALKSK